MSVDSKNINHLVYLIITITYNYGQFRLIRAF